MMTTLRELKFKQATEYILAHPDETKEQQAIGAKVSTATIAIARRALISESRLPPSRKPQATAKAPKRRSAPPTTPRAVEVPVPTDESAEPALDNPSKPSKMLDHEAMKAMSDMIDMYDAGDLTEEEIEKRVIKQCLRFIFDPRLHPDTRMSASTLWQKLKEKAKAKDLGPSVPMTRAEATSRLKEMMVACGPTITLAAVNEAFTVEPSDEGKVPTDAPEAPLSPPGTPQSPGSPPDLRPDGGTAGPQPLG
jgi:hypothetical protein